MKVTEHEMRGLLTGKCVPGNIKVNEEISAYLVRQFAALHEQVKLLAAENAALKELATGYADRADQLLSDLTGNCESDHRRECFEECNKTPATDAWLNEVLAQGVERAADCLFEETNIGAHEHECLMAYAAQLRATEQGGNHA